MKKIITISILCLIIGIIVGYNWKPIKKYLSFEPKYTLYFEVNCGTLNKGWFEKGGKDDKNELKLILTNNFYFCNSFNERRTLNQCN